MKENKTDTISRRESQDQPKRPRIFAFTVLIIMMFSATACLANATYYAGYFYYGPPSGGSPPPNGCGASIYTIDKSVSGSNFYCQWVDVNLSYSPNYWMQVGYSKGYDSDYARKWYTERQDSNGYSITWRDNGPSSGSTYFYWIYRSSGSSTWTLGVDGQFSRTMTPSPYSPTDYEGFSETTSNSIDIDGTHISNLQYKQGSDWYFWDQHYVFEQSPYSVTETSDYEFYAEGP